MTLEEFKEKLRLSMQNTKMTPDKILNTNIGKNNAQVTNNTISKNLPNSNINKSNIEKRSISVVNNKNNITPEKLLNNQIKKNYSLPTKKSIWDKMEEFTEGTLNGYASNNSYKTSDFANDLKENGKNFLLGAKSGGLNFINYFAKVGDTISEKVFNRGEKTEKALDEDLKKYGIDGTNLSTEDKIKALVDVDPLSMDKYNRMLISKGTGHKGNDSLSNIKNALSVLQGNSNNVLISPFKDMVNGKTLTENEKGEIIPDTWYGTNEEKAIDNEIIKTQEEANKNTEKVKNPVLKYTSELMPSIGNNTTPAVLSLISPEASTLFFTGSAGNSYALDGKEKGLSDDSALLYGSILGTLDGQLEKIGLEKFSAGTKDIFNGEVKKALKNHVINVVDNYLQEAAMEPAQEIVNQIFTGKSDWDNMPSRMNEAGKAGAVSSMIMGAGSSMIAKGAGAIKNISSDTTEIRKLRNSVTEKINKSELLDENIKSTLKGTINKANPEALNNLNRDLNSIDEVITQLNKENVTQTILNKRNNTINNNLGNMNDSKSNIVLAPTSQDTSIKENYSKYKNANLNSEIINNAMELVPSNKQNRRTKEQWLKVAEQIGNSVSSEEAEMYAYKTWMDMKPNNKVNLNRQGKSYVPFTIQEWVNSVKEANTNAQNTNIQNNTLNNQTQVAPFSMQDVNIQQQDTGNLNYEESAQKYNIDTKNATVRSIYDVANKRGLNVRYDNTIFSDNSQNAIWKVNEDGTREVVLNPNADTNKALQSVMIHELTHDMEGTLEYKALSDLVLDYSKSLEDYEKSRKDLENMYSKVYDKNSENFESLVDQEIVADVLGEKLGNQEFVDSLVNQNRNVAQKIYDWVISKLNSFTRAIGFNSEYLYWRDVENKFRKAFNTDLNNYDSNVKYSQSHEFLDSKNKIWYNEDGIDIDNKENYQISSYINTNYPRMKIGELFAKEVGDWLYVGKKTSDGEFKYYAKVQIEGNENRIVNIKRSIKEDGINGERESFSEIIQIIKNVRRTNSGNTFGGADRKSGGQIDRLYSRQSKNSNIRKNTSQSTSNQSRIENNKELATTSSFFDSKTDNKGRQLSQLQQEYFKNSKVRDKNGNLLEVYHGTPYSFNVFNYQKLGENTSSLGAGFYFTDSEKTGSAYTRENGELKKVYLDIQKPMSYGKTTMTKSEYKAFIEGVNNETNGNYLEDYDGINNALMEYDFGGDDIDLVNAVHNASGLTWEKTFEILKNTTGFDGIISEKGFLNKNETIYVAFNSNQIKNVDNLNPTSNADIRYSKNSEGQWQNFLTENFKNNGTQETIKDVKLAPTKEDIKNTNKIAPTTKEVQLKNDVDNFSKQVDSVKNGTYPKNDMLTLLSQTPKPLLDIGLNDLPITMTQRHLETIMNKTGKYKNANYHDLGEEIVKQLPEAINNPLDIVQSNTDPNSIVLTTYLADKQNRTVIASIKIDGRGQINNIEIDTNVMTSAYGRSNYDKFMQDNIKNGNLLYDIDKGVIKKATMARLQLPRHSSYVDAVDNASTTNNIIPSSENYVNNEQNSVKISPTKKTMNPVQIVNMTEEDASSTLKLPIKNYEKGNKESRFYKNITNNSKFLNSELRAELKNNEDVKFYKGITNEESLTNALKKLNDGGQSETLNWLNKKDNFTSDDISEGWILLKRYQDVGDYTGAVEVAKKMRDIGSKAGQTIQAFNIMNRLTPEGMTLYAQSELTEAFEKISKNKTQKWIDENKNDFELTAEEQEFIKNNVLEAQKLDENSRERKIKLAEIQKMMSDKLPAEKGAGIKSWMRISMLFNPKTQVRNVMGNALIAPVNFASDTISAGIDKLVSNFTGVRTTGKTNFSNFGKGFEKGLYESYDDFKRGINTRDMSGNRFEISPTKSFNDSNVLSKMLNKTDKLLSFVLDAGDRPFYEATFTNSINNQLKLNNTTEITQDMIDIATEEALQRTWQDNNEYTKFVLDIRRAFNKLNVGGYGLGDVLIPFAKTPANLTKAIVDYSPVGLVKSIVEGNNLKNAISRGDITAQQQHKFVQDLGKATAGTMLYVLGYALAKAGIITGESDEDKDVANFMKNNLGINSYSIKIGNTSFTYDWAQPLASPFGIMANFINQDRDDSDKDVLTRAMNLVDLPVNMILEQSFMQSIQDVLSNNGGVVEGVAQQVLDLPSRAIPTFLKQIVDMTDSTQRQTYVKGDMLATAKNKVLSKIPGVSKMLAPTIDTMGNEVKKYGGKNNIFNVFFNPANVNSSNISKSGKEIYNVYQKTGDKTILPRTATYSLTFNGNNYNLSNEEKAKYQTTMGKYVDDNVSKLLNNKSYKQLTDTEKVKIINEIVSDSNEIAKLEYAKEHRLDYERTSTDVNVDDEITKGLDTANAYIYKTIVSKKDGDKDSEGKTINGSTTKNKVNYIMNMQIDDNQKQHLVNLLADKTDYNISVQDLKMLNGNYLIYIQQSGKNSDGKDISPRQEYMNYIKSGINVTELNKFYNKKGDLVALKDENGKSISGSKKQLTFMYVNSLNLNIPQKMILLASQYDSFGKTYYKQILEYLNTLNLSNDDKSNIIKTVLL